MMDTIKAKLHRDKARGPAREQGDKIEQGMDKTSSMADEKTKGEHSGRIDAGTDKAKDTLRRQSGKDEGSGT
ncbi:antitoxin [Streptomyces sp. NPDC004647]|uniref:antitoxin n=1 Tax=Streptomyces sp. NPDC004647 TaxID=3154671 RepID=UPI0033BD2393